MATISAVILSAALLLAMILNLALKPSFSARITRWCLCAAAIGGLLYYGLGFYETTGDLALTVIRTPVFVLRMFIGVNELGAISSSRLVSTEPGLIGFWLAHLLAFYSMASAAMTALGAELLRQLRFLLSGRGDLTLIYGLNDDSAALGKECVKAGDGSVVFVTENASAETVAELNKEGMSVLTGAAAEADRKSLRRLRLKKRKISVYALDAADDRNLFFALRLKDTLAELQVAPENTRVTLPGAEDIVGSMLQVSAEQYGFGYVNVFDRSMLAARALIRTVPPWDFVAFGPDGRAKEDFECVIAGFGSHGQAALRQLVMNGQFAGSSFKAAIFSPNYEKESGYLRCDCPEIFARYDVEGFESDARSVEFYRYLASRLKTLKLIVIATGDAETNREISDNLMLFLKRRRAENICVVRCGDGGVRYQERVGSPIISRGIYTRAFLSAEDADRGAIILNASYDGSDRSDWEKWVACDSFGKMSSRASADFSPAFIRASGSSREALLAGEWEPSGELLENLGETEHLRWNAFHFAMGYRPMSRTEFEANAQRWKELRDEGKAPGFKIAKNGEERTHACLVGWDELGELAERENAVTGRGVDYRQLDINNVLALPKLLRAEEAGGPGK